eukprot:9345157-Pyramimonas_sp.AAC.1
MHPHTRDGGCFSANSPCSKSRAKRRSSAACVTARAMHNIHSSVFQHAAGIIEQYILELTKPCTHTSESKHHLGIDY